MVVPMACYKPLRFHCQECDEEHNTYDPTEVLLLAEVESLKAASEVFENAEDLALQSQQYKLSVTIGEGIVPTLFGLWVSELDFN